jgi:PAS domain S-box-containing protein
VEAPRRTRLLLIDDDQGDFEMTRAMVGQIPRAQLTLDWVSSFSEGMEAIERDEHDVYLVDYLLEDRDGLELVRWAREQGVRKPMIMLTGRGSHDVDVEAMKAGASDYLVKGKVDPDLLERSIRYALERVRAEEALRDSEERHRGMFDHLPIGLYRTSLDGEFMDANPALVRILGYPDPRRLQSVYAAELYVNPADRRRFREMLDRYGIARGFETRLKRVDGSTVLVRNTARAHRGPDGRILYIEGAVEDVTEVDRANVFREGAEHFRAVFEESKLAILLVDLHGLIVEANPAFQRAFGYGEDGLRGRPLQELVIPEERAAVAHEQLALAAGGTPRSTAERRLLSEDGAVLWARCISSLVVDAQGDPSHIMVLLEDLAEVTEGAGVW